MRKLVAPLLSCVLMSALGMAQGADAGRTVFNTRCAICHGGDAAGGEHGPDIRVRLAGHADDPELASFIRHGLPSRGMPGTDLPESEMRDLVAFLRTVEAQSRNAPKPLVRKSVKTTEGGALDGVVLAENTNELQLRTDDGQIHLLRKTGESYRPVTSEVDWPTYHGNIDGNRYSTMNQINRSNVAKLAPAWIFHFPDTANLQTTPVVVGGIMYVTSANECFALDAGSGRQLWHFQRPRTERLIGNAAGGFNRGVAIAGERLFMVTDNAHLISLDRFTGKLLWETEIADWRQNYNATGAPLIVHNLVISGTAGGEEGVRGLLAAYDQQTGKEVWRFWTVPKPGEPKSETWVGPDIAHGGAPTWLTGSYDPELDLVFWPTGNAGPDLNGDQRKGDNLYSCSMLALEAKTGKLRWYYQFTPHDEWDWDSAEPPVLVDTNWHGQPRKLLLHGNRNGFFYVLDRTNGKVLQATPLVKKVTWAKEIGPDGRPVIVPDKTPTTEGNVVCPSQIGATNWFSSSYNPATGLFYVQTLDACMVFFKHPVEWEAGKSFWGGTVRRVPGETLQKVLRAIDIQTGKFTWEIPQTGTGSSWGGVLSTAGGLVFFGDDGGDFAAADASTGKRLWNFPANQLWKASPMTYMFGGQQYVAVAGGPNVLSFALKQ
jgi:alcohol dehydrogenase (cytochrome c)